jgi:DnaK suppressor protein
VAKATIKKPSAGKIKTKSAASGPAKASGRVSVKRGTTKSAALKAAQTKAKVPTKATTKGAALKAAASRAVPRVELKPVKPQTAHAAATPINHKPEKLMKKSKDADRNDRKGVNVPAPVPTDVKPQKNQAGLKASELEHFRDLLLAKRRELVGDMSSMEREALQRGGSSNLSNLPLHMADMGTDNYEQEFTLGLMEKDRDLLRQINNALAKIQDGTYGLCEGTGLPISKPRLEAQPWARFSIEHARKLEQRMGR